jgi:putative ABC transport system permease protein
MHRLLARIRALWHWRRNEAELDEEIRFHLAEEEAERRAAGMSDDEARVAAAREFGNVPLVRERTRDAWGWSEAERLWNDARFSLRSLRRQWSFSAIAVLTLALGIGATTAVLSIVNALLIRSLPFDAASELVQVYATTPARNIYRDTTSFWDFSEWKKAGAVVSATAFRMPPMILSGGGSPELVYALQASHDIFRVLRVQPILGRAFTADEQRAQTAVAVLSHDLWTRRYGSDPQIAGRAVVLDETPYTVVGVMPPGFQFPAYTNPGMLIPIHERPCRSCGYLRVVARLAPGATIVTAQQQLNQIASGLAQAFPDSNAGRGVWLQPFADVAVGAVRSPILLLLAASVLVLLIGCANVANLILARGLARSRELAVRSALGAGAGRLVRQLLAESVVVAVIAAALGLVLSIVGRRLLIAGFDSFPMPPVDFDWALLSFTALIAIVTGLLSGVPLALMVWRTKLADALKEDGRSQSLGTTERRLGSILVAGQIALAVMLLTTAALFTIEFIGLQRIDVGFDTTRSLSADLLLSRHHADPARRPAFTQQLLDEIAALPGVRAVAAHVDPPIQGGRRETFSVEGREDPAPDRGHSAGFDIVTDRFFDAMGIGLSRGRAFTAHDTDSAMPVAIVNETMARALWPGELAVGKRLRFYYERSPERWLTIVGVSREIRYHGRLLEDPIPQVFVPASQRFYKAQDPSMSLVIRTDTAPASQLAAVRERIWAVDRDQAIVRLRTLDDILTSQTATTRAYSALLLIYAVIALVIAGAGIYALNAYTVTRRTREIGIRLAMGATSGGVVRMILRQSMAVVAIGLALGTAGSIALGRVTMRFVGHFATATSLPVLSTVLLLFASVALVAALVPALRAMHVDPALAFRAD